MNAYSEDLRQKIVEAVERGMPKSERFTPNLRAVSVLETPLLTDSTILVRRSTE